MSVMEAPLFYTYKRFPVTFVAGHGATLIDDAGKEYIDCLAGIAVASAGHANPEVARAIAEQAATLVHVSNYFWTKPMAELAAKLREITGGWGRIFFGNSGAEANECAIKLAKKLGAPTGRYKILCAQGSFHGRTLATLAATGQPAKWEGFQPLLPGFVHAEFNNLESFRANVDTQTAAIMVEPIQGERGVVPATLDFLKGLRKLADENSIPLIFDEVQTGIGRTGNWWAFQSYGVKPDIFTSAKAIASGLPLGVCIADEPFASAFVPGDHASTFGGGPVVCAAGVATISYLEKSGAVKQAAELGELFKQQLAELPHVIQVRGMGLMLAAVLDSDISHAVTETALKNGLVVNSVIPNAVRLVPPLVITEPEIRRAVEILRQAITAVAGDC